MNYGKIENGAVTLLNKDDSGALPIYSMPMPETKPDEGTFWESGWEQKDDRIEMVWFLEKLESSAEEIVDILTGENND